MGQSDEAISNPLIVLSRDCFATLAMTRYTNKSDLLWISNFTLDSGFAVSIALTPVLDHGNPVLVAYPGWRLMS